uniref:SH3 domain-containing protein n=1 Tax=Callorhinchus milii TaxID=7868 RepID=A0A4W3HQV5_CALMI
MEASKASGQALPLVQVEFNYEYTARDGRLITIRENERYHLLSRTTQHWWHVRKDQETKPFYVPANYVKELPGSGLQCVNGSAVTGSREEISPGLSESEPRLPEMHSSSAPAPICTLCVCTACEFVRCVCALCVSLCTVCVHCVCARCVCVCALCTRARDVGLSWIRMNRPEVVSATQKIFASLSQSQSQSLAVACRCVGGCGEVGWGAASQSQGPDEAVKGPGAPPSPPPTHPPWFSIVQSCRVGGISGSQSS